MALVVETGAGVPGANTYADVATVAAYAASLGLAFLKPDGDTADAAREAAILRAMRYIDGLSWFGVKAAQDNPRKWPRSGVVDDSGFTVDSDTVPQAVVDALCEAAIRELASPGFLSPDLDRGGAVKRLLVVGAVETEYEAGASPTVRVTAIEQLLRGLVRGKGVVEVGRG